MRRASVRRNARRALRSALALRPRRRSQAGRSARPVGGGRARVARHDFATLDQDGRHVRADESQARVLPVDGVPARPLARQQRRERAVDAARARRAAREGAAVAAAHGNGAGCRARQRRARAPRGLLHRFDGDVADPGHGLRPALRVRYFQAELQGRLATRAAGQLVAPTRSLGSRAAARRRRSEARGLVRNSGRRAQTDLRSSIELARYSFRPSRRRLWRQDDQHASALGGGDARLFRFPTIQPRRVRRRAGGDPCGRIADARAVSG
jgi:hypothetical protein